MFNIILILTLVILGFLGYNFNDETLHVIGILLLITSFLWFIFSLISNLSQYSSQILRFENLREYLEKIEIYKKQKEELLTEFKFYLGDKYPEFEKNIFENFNKNNSEHFSLVLKYPELQSSELIKMLTHKIYEMTTKIYDKKLDLENECKLIRYYNQGKWELIKPQIPKELTNIIFKSLPQ